MIVKQTARKNGFTIVELLIVVIIIAILATLVVVVYGQMRQRSEASALASDIVTTAKAVESTRTATGSYPATLNDLTFGKDAVQASQTSFQYTAAGTGDAATFCLTGIRDDIVRHFNSSDSGVTDGACAGHSSGTASIVYTGTGTFNGAGGTPVALSISADLQSTDVVIIMFTADYNTIFDSVTTNSTSYTQFYNRSMGATGYQRIVGYKASGLTGTQTGTFLAHWSFGAGTVKGDYSVYVIRGVVGTVATTDTTYGNQAASTYFAPAAQTISKGQVAIYNYCYYGNYMPTPTDASTGGFTWTNVMTRTGPTQNPQSDSRYVVAPRSGSVQFGLNTPASGVITIGSVLVTIK